MTVKRKRIIFGIILPMAVLVAWASRTPIQIRQYDRAFAEVTRGMNESRVIELMGKPHSIDAVADAAYWGDDILPDAAASDVRQQFWYNVHTFFVPISWTIGFDKNGRVISKHRWD